VEVEEEEEEDLGPSLEWPRQPPAAELCNMIVQARYLS